MPRRQKQADRWTAYKTMQSSIRDPESVTLLREFAEHLRSSRHYPMFDMNFWVYDGRASPIGEMTAKWPTIWKFHDRQPGLDVPGYRGKPWKSAAYWFGIIERDAIALFDGCGDVGTGDQLIPASLSRVWLGLHDYPMRNQDPQLVVDNIYRFLDTLDETQQEEPAGESGVQGWPIGLGHA